MLVFTSVQGVSGVQDDSGILNILKTVDQIGWIGIGAFGLALCTVNTQIFRSKAYKLAESGSQLAPLIFTNMLFSALWQGVFFDDVFSTQQLVGINLIVAASLTNTLLAKKHNKSRKAAPVRTSKEDSVLDLQAIVKR